MHSLFTKRFTSFTYLNITQFLGALNDNIYKLLIVYFLLQLQGNDNSHIILACTGATFVIPFLLFSSSSGTLADRVSKRNIIVLTKILEILAMALGVLAFAYESVWGSYSVLFLLATQSAIFGPSKYGIVPEIVTTEKITKANGLMTSFTFLAIITGTFLASFITDVTNHNFILGTLLCTLVALVGILTSLGIEYTLPSGSKQKFHILFLLDIFKTIKRAKEEPSLVPAMFGSAYFLFLGAFIQLNIIPFAMESLSLTSVQGGYLFLVTALGIGTGAFLAGKISGKSVELALVPLAAFGIVFALFILNYFSSHLFAVIPIIIVLGILGGIYQVPLDSYIQVTSPNHCRGQIVGATNFLSFMGVLFASGAVYLFAGPFHLRANEGFAIIGYLTFFVAIGYTFQFFDYVTRFIGMILSRIHFKTTVLGSENLPTTPVLYVCKHTAWNDLLLLLGAQRRRVRFLIGQEQEHSSKILKKLYKFLRILWISPIDPLEMNSQCLSSIQKTLKKGISVCIFTENPNLDNEIEKIKASQTFREIIEKSHAVIVPVIIDKGEKQESSPFMSQLRKKIRVPASISFGSSISLHLI